MTKWRGNRPGKVSVKSRLKDTMQVASSYQGEATGLRVVLGETRDQLRAARFAAHWYRRRWLWTLSALILVVLAVGLASLG